MTEQELQAIEERANKATNAPWIVEAGEYSGRNWLIGGSAVDGKTYFVTTQNVHASELEGDASTDADFIAHARADVPALIAEVRSLRAKLDAVPEYATYYRERNVWEDELPMTLDEWLAKQEVQP